MGNPTKYTRQFDYAAVTLADLRSNLNPEFSTIQVSIDEIVEAIKDVRRSDGALQNEIVTLDSLSPELVDLLVFEADVWTKDDFTQQDVDNWNVAFSWGDHNQQGYVVYDNGLQVTQSGDPRGTRAIDLQAIRSQPDQVASGLQSAILGGMDNRASGQNSVAMTQGADARESSSVAIGQNSIASGERAIAVGPSSEAQGVNSVALGHLAITGADALSAVSIGRLAWAQHQGAMVLSDSQSGTKASSLPHQLSLYFANGARLNGSALVTETDLGAAALSNDHADLDGVGSNTHPDIDAHIGQESAGVHGSTPDAVAGAIVHRDAGGRAKIADPSSGSDIANKGYVDSQVSAQVSGAFIRTSNLNVNAADILVFTAADTTPLGFVQNVEFSSGLIILPDDTITTPDDTELAGRAKVSLFIEKTGEGDIDVRVTTTSGINPMDETFTLSKEDNLSLNFATPFGRNVSGLRIFASQVSGTSAITSRSHICVARVSAVG